MRCFKAKQKLTELKFDSSAIACDQILLNHLSECSECESLLASEQILKRDLKAAATSDNEEVVSWWLLKSQVERKAATETSTKFMENLSMAIIRNFLQNRSKLSVGIAAIAAVLLLSVLVPFSYNETIGYEVAFAGVDKNLAMDANKINDLLAKLGIVGAAIDVSGCEATCNVKITDLKTTDDARLVVAAFDQIKNVVVLDEIHEMTTDKIGNIFKMIAYGVGDGGECKNIANFSADDGVYEILIEKLGENPEHEIFIWVGEGEECDTMNFDPANNEFFFMADDGSATMDIQADTDENGLVSLTINAGTPNEEVITFDAHNIDDETLAKLEAMGISPHMFKADGNNQLHKVIEIKTDCNPTDPDANAKLGDLPDRFSLSQNYPNPFNPTTTIGFSVPSSQHVTLEIINVKGQVVKTLVDQTMSAGEHSIEWDATNSSGTKVASGIYIYKLATGDNVAVKKMTLLK